MPLHEAALQRPQKQKFARNLKGRGMWQSYTGEKLTGKKLTGPRRKNGKLNRQSTVDASMTACGSSKAYETCFDLTEDKAVTIDSIFMAMELQPPHSAGVCT